MNNYLEKTIMDLSGYFRKVYFSGDFSSKRGLIQTLNPSIALIVLISFIIVTVLIRDFYFLVILYIISLALVLLSRITFKFYVKSIAFIPLFTSMIIIPYLFYPFSPPPFIFKISIFEFSLCITYTGLKFSAMLILRVITAVSFMITITYGIGFQKVLNSMKSLKFPEILLNILSFTYRYLFMIISQVYDILLSRKSKMCKENKKIAKKWQSYLLGHIFFRSHIMGENIYYSMVSKGYTGETPGKARRMHVTYVDVFFIIFFIFIILLNVLSGW